MRTIRNGIAVLLAAVLMLASASCGKAADDSLRARFTALYATDVLSDMLADPAQYVDEIAAYGLDDFAGTFAREDDFRSYTVEISVQNTNDYAVQLLNMQMETAKQGAKGVWFAALTNMPTVGLPANYTDRETLFLYAIADASLSQTDVLRTLGKMDISCVYMKGSEAPEADAQLDPALLSASEVLYEG